MRHLKALSLWLPAALWYRLIWGFSAQTASVSGGTSDGLISRLLSLISPAFAGADAAARFAAVELLSFYVRKGAHMFLYFVLALLVWLALSSLPLRRIGRAAALVPLCAALAALDEYHQTLVPGRSGELRDVLVDLTGTLIALFLLSLPSLARWLKKNPRWFWLPWLFPAAAGVLLLIAALADPVVLFARRAAVTEELLPFSETERAALLAAAAPILRQALLWTAGGLLALNAALTAFLKKDR